VISRDYIMLINFLDNVILSKFQLNLQLWDQVAGLKPLSKMIAIDHGHLWIQGLIVLQIMMNT
jgi:hypothetical protein